MSVKVRIPSPLRKCTGDKDEIEAAGNTVLEVLQDMERQYPDLRGRIRGEDGKVRRFANIYLNDEDMRFLQKEETLVKDGDEMAIIPAVQGGR